MIYSCAKDWHSAESKRVLLLGMSGVGKTYISDILRKSGEWFHYSVDYRIGTRYMGEKIVDNFKREAMRNPFLARLLKSDSIYIASNISFSNLEPLSAYLGKPGNPDRGGIPMGEYERRQQLHFDAEVAALKDTPHFIHRSGDIYNYKHFVCDSGGSICEVVNPDDPNDEILKLLSERLLLVWINGGKKIEEMLLKRFSANPKPMYYNPRFLQENWAEYCRLNKVQENDVDPDKFAGWVYVRALKMRQPKYRSIARNWGVEISVENAASISTPEEFCKLVGQSLNNGVRRTGASDQGSIQACP